jgi:hypothetical protein
MGQRLGEPGRGVAVPGDRYEAWCCRQVDEQAPFVACAKARERLAAVRGFVGQWCPHQVRTCSQPGVPAARLAVAARRGRLGQDHLHLVVTEHDLMTLYPAIGTAVLSFPEGRTEQVQGRWRKRALRPALPLVWWRCLALCLVALGGTGGPPCTGLASIRHPIASLGIGRGVRRRVGQLLPAVSRKPVSLLPGVAPRQVVISRRRDGRSVGVAGRLRSWRAAAGGLLKIGGGGLGAAEPGRVARYVVRMARPLRGF